MASLSFFMTHGILDPLRFLHVRAFMYILFTSSCLKIRLVITLAIPVPMPLPWVSGDKSSRHIRSARRPPVAKGVANDPVTLGSMPSPLKFFPISSTISTSQAGSKIRDFHRRRNRTAYRLFRNSVTGQKFFLTFRTGSAMTSHCRHNKRLCTTIL